MSPEQIAAIAGLLLSLAFSYIPGLNSWFDALEPTIKRLIMAGLLVVVSVAAFALSCANVVAVATCDQAGALGLVNAFIAALVANQAAYLIAPRRSERR